MVDTTNAIKELSAAIDGVKASVVKKLNEVAHSELTPAGEPRVAYTFSIHVSVCSDGTYDWSSETYGEGGILVPPAEEAATQKRLVQALRDFETKSGTPVKKGHVVTLDQTE